jgi:threonine dehydratase
MRFCKAIGGGGFDIWNWGIYVKRLRPEIKIIGVEPVDADAMNQSLKAGHRAFVSGGFVCWMG